VNLVIGLIGYLLTGFSNKEVGFYGLVKGGQMKKKSAKVKKFIEDMHEYITNNPQFRRDTRTKSETQVQAEIRPLIIQYLEKYFEKGGYKDVVAKANKSFYWEGQEGQYGKARATTFGSRNYPDYIVTDPYFQLSFLSPVGQHGVPSRTNFLKNKLSLGYEYLGEELD
jgi:hypothetical protein